MKKVVSLLAFFVLAIGLLAGCGNGQQAAEKDKKAGMEKEQATIVVKDAEGKKTAEEKVDLKGQNLQDLMKEHFKVKENKGFFVEIEGISQDEAKNLYWVFEINGEQATKGAKDITPEKGDKIVWELIDFS
ncbi:DUF4430 domain-containing protein [Mesobacillus zeae]|nr:DUF4430 domain-containing protein [Mesobacillus zeae]